jgi:hypothetical protein
VALTVLTTPLLVDELGYERGSIDTSLLFPELRRRSEITTKAKAAYAVPDFSGRIPDGLPGARTAAETAHAP